MTDGHDTGTEATGEPTGSSADAALDAPPDVTVDLGDAAMPDAAPSPGPGQGADASEPLGELLLRLLRIPSVTGEEAAIADWLARRYAERGEQVERVGNSVVVGAVRDPERPTVLLVGHTDTVPATLEDRTPRREDGRIVGRGASDMKSGLAVAMSVFEDPALRAGRHNLALVAYAAEEGPHERNELGAVLERIPALSDAAFALVLEPTDLAVQLGCLGTIHAEIAFAGKAAHSARPWHGENALTRAGTFLSALHGLSPTDVGIDGLVYREVMTATAAWTGGGAAPGRGARNVVPDRFTVNLNYRFAPDKTVDQAQARLEGLVGSAATVTVVDRAPAAPPRRDAPAARAFIAAAQDAGAEIEPKQAWTDVARFAEIGVPAANYGPGATAQAHQAGEWVEEAHLHTARAVVADFLAGRGRMPADDHGQADG